MTARPAGGAGAAPADAADGEARAPAGATAKVGDAGRRAPCSRYTLPSTRRAPPLREGTRVRLFFLQASHPPPGRTGVGSLC